MLNTKSDPLGTNFAAPSTVNSCAPKPGLNLPRRFSPSSFLFITSSPVSPQQRRAFKCGLSCSGNPHGTAWSEKGNVPEVNVAPGFSNGADQFNRHSPVLHALERIQSRDDFGADAIELAAHGFTVAGQDQCRIGGAIVNPVERLGPGYADKR